MTAIKTKPSSLADMASSEDDVRPSRNSIPPSATDEVAKTRFASALSKGVDTLLGRGHGRERASAELLNEIADGCTPGEDEVFQTMESLGISLEDAKKVMTVSAAFRKAQTAKGGSPIEAIDELTSRLKLEDSSHKGGSSRSPSPTPSATSTLATSSTIKITDLTRNESVDSLLQSQPAAAMAKKGQRPTRAKSQQQGRGRKRALAEKTPEKRDSNVMIEEQPKNKAAVADLDVKEKLMNAKLSKAAEGKKPKSSSARAKSPEGGLGARGKRASSAVLHVEEAAQPKRPRTRSQTEESIPAII